MLIGAYQPHGTTLGGCAPAISYRSNFALTRPAKIGLKEAQRIRNDMSCA